MPLFKPKDPRAADNAIRLRLRDIAQLFNSLDPSPFSEQDLDHDAEEFIVSWARELQSNPELKLILTIERPLPEPQTPGTVGDSIRHYFAYRASINRLELRDLLKRGRTSLLIGITFLAGCLLLAQSITERQGAGAVWSIAREGLTIGGWVAMWRPMEIYLYDWWPLKSRGNLLRRLSRMHVQLAVSPPKGSS